MHIYERTVIQLKCMEIAKWSWSAEVGYDVGWQKTSERWVDGGFAEAFAIVFDEINKEEEKNIDILKVYNNTIKLVCKK